MTKYIQHGNTFDVTADSNLVVKDSLPSGTYTIGIEPERGLFLVRVGDYEIGKIYGDAEKNAERIYATFMDRANRSVSTGALLVGEKGSGKMLLAKIISAKGIAHGVPTIIINTPLCGEFFNKFIQSIDQPCVIVFDEYEKIYSDEKHQNALLTLFDGVYPTAKLFLITSNSKWKVSEMMRNRPGRLYYHLEYGGLEAAFVREYCVENLTNKKNLASVIQVSEMFDHFNFDMLKAMVEEMNRYDETAQQVLKFMNIKIETYARLFDIQMTMNGEPSFAVQSGEFGISINPTNSFIVYYCMTKKEHDKKDWKTLDVSVDDLKNIKNGEYFYESPDEGWTLTLRKPEKKKPSLEEIALAA